jgi:hypothetical protein
MNRDGTKGKIENKIIVKIGLFIFRSYGRLGETNSL